MYSKALLVAAFLIFETIPSVAQQLCYRTNEDCKKACSVMRPWGCIARVDDPVCLARKAIKIKCPDFSDNILATVLGNIETTTRIPQMVTLDCIRNVNDCARDILSQIVYSQVRPLVDSYIRDIRNQAQQKGLMEIHPNIRRMIQRFYTVDIAAVRYAFYINTHHGQHVTIGNTIFWTRDMDYNNIDDFRTLLHELEHSEQYKLKGGEQNFLAEYILQSAGSIFRGGNTVDMHDSLVLEKSADAKANNVMYELADTVPWTPPVPTPENRNNR